MIERTDDENTGKLDEDAGTGVSDGEHPGLTYHEDRQRACRTTLLWRGSMRRTRVRGKTGEFRSERPGSRGRVRSCPLRWVRWGGPGFMLGITERLEVDERKKLDAVSVSVRRFEKSASPGKGRRARGRSGWGWGLWGSSIKARRVRRLRRPCHPPPSLPKWLAQTSPPAPPPSPSAPSWSR